VAVNRRKNSGPPSRPALLPGPAGESGREEHFTLAAIMTKNPVAFPENETVLSVCENMARGRIGQVVVVDKHWRPRFRLESPPEPKGIFTERDLIRAFAAHKEKVLGMTVGELMTSPVLTLGPEEDIGHAADMMLLMRIRRIPVVEKGRTVGLVTRGRVMEAQAARLARVQEQNRQLEERVVHDPLTGLANRVLFEEVLKREIGKAASRGGAVSLLALDLDHFKKVNDTYGHPVGDLVLRQFAGVLRSSLRRADLPARVGGEEFGVILTQPLAEAALVAEKVRKGVTEEAFGEQGDAFHLSVSIGCAGWKNSATSPEALIKAADEALYEAKKSGRNRVVSR
jgi:diguanylate cyclase (GGDEF)-like protein